MNRGERTRLACLSAAFEAGRPARRLPPGKLPNELSDGALLRAIDALSSLGRGSRTSYTVWRLALLRTEAIWRGLLRNSD